jgi:hypothetical protein|tara:strand:+ start:1036 stop:1356 length:321 start_codon:yes stop_codon:yes gene_type:complete
MNKDHINIKNTRIWVKCNEDAKAHLWRDKFISEHGGEFVKNGQTWKWQNIHKVEKSKYELTDADGNITIVENLAKFCRENELNKGAIHKVIKGDRKQHKGFTCRKI